LLTVNVYATTDVLDPVAGGGSASNDAAACRILSLSSSWSMHLFNAVSLRHIAALAIDLVGVYSYYSLYTHTQATCNKLHHAVQNHKVSYRLRYFILNVTCIRRLIDQKVRYKCKIV
jgi:hypothetical protein